MSDSGLNKIPPAFPDDFFIMVHAKWCGHCQTALPIWRKLEKSDDKYKNMVFWIEQDNVKNNGIMSNITGIDGYPTFLHIKNGRDVGRYSGERTVKGFQDWIDSELEKKGGRRSRARRGGCWMTTHRRRRRSSKSRSRRRSRRS